MYVTTKASASDELQKEICTILSHIEGGFGRVDAEMRAQLLPALEILRQRLPHGQWEKFLLDNNLNPTTVRKWRAREKASTTSLLELLGEPQQKKKPRREMMSESAALQLAKAGKRLAKAVVGNNPQYAKKLAEDYLEGFAEAA